MKVLSKVTLGAALLIALGGSAFAGELHGVCMGLTADAGMSSADADAACTCLDEKASVDQAIYDEFLSKSSISDPAERHAALSDGAKSVSDACFPQ